MSWRYRLDEAVEVSAPELLGIEFQNEWITIRHGRLRIERDYAWDGPLGTDGRPASRQATLVHDALCQFRPDIAGRCGAIQDAAAAAETQAELDLIDVNAGWPV